MEKIAALEIYLVSCISPTHQAGQASCSVLAAAPKSGAGTKQSSDWSFKCCCSDEICLGSAFHITSTLPVVRFVA